MVDRQPLLFLNGVALAALGVAMLLPAFVDLLDRAPDAQVFFASAGVTLATGGFFITASGGLGTRFNRKTGFFVLSTLWLGVPLFAALPFAFSALRLSYIDGLFEATAGLTTTGATVIGHLDSAPRGILLWRALLNWIGGAGVIAMAIVLLPFLQVGGMQLFRTEASDRSGRVLPGTRETAIAILVAYLALDVTCGLSYWFGGMSGFDALCHALSTISTGGFSTHDASIGFYQPPALRWIAIVFMVAGALPLVMYLRLARGEIGTLWRDTQVVTFLAVIIGATALLAFYHVSPGQPFLQSVPDSLFDVVSAVTSTGYTAAHAAPWPPLPALLILILTVHGGCAGSTAGGVKTMRVEVLMRQIFTQIRRILLPHSVTVMHYGGRPLAPEIASTVATFVLLYLFTIFAVAFCLGLLGADFFQGLWAAAAAVSNGGLGLTDGFLQIVHTSPNAEGAKIVLAGGMLAGRLELVTVLVLFTVTYWRS